MKENMGQMNKDDISERNEESGTIELQGTNKSS